jgi:excisionase family DNA binding protein
MSWHRLAGGDYFGIVTSGGFDYVRHCLLMRTGEWLSPEELAEELGIPVGTIYQWRYRNVGPPVHKIGRHLRFRRSDVEAWLEQQKCAKPV